MKTLTEIKAAMKASKELEKRVKEVIIDNNGKCSLKNAVTIKLKQSIGFNYETKEHDYTILDWSIIEVLRCGKKGVVYVSDGINQWRPSKLSHLECEAIIREIDA